MDSKSVYHHTGWVFLGLLFVKLEGKVRRILLINFSLILRRQLLPLVFLICFHRRFLIQSDLKGSLSQDLWKRSREEEERSHLQFYFNICENGWHCKICSTFSPPVITATPFVNKAGTFGDHPTRNANTHLQTWDHKDLSKQRTDVWKLLQEAALSTEISVAATNCFVIKSFFRITWLLVKKN